MPDDQTNETSRPLIEDQYYRDFLSGKGPFESQVDFPNRFQRIVAETNRRLARAQLDVVKAQNVLIESQGAVAKSLERATWVLSFATIALVLATLAPLLPPLLAKL